MVARTEIPNPQAHAEDQLVRMEVEAEGMGESTHFFLARFAAVPLGPGRFTHNFGRELFVERSIYGHLRYRRFLDCGWNCVPEWAYAHLTREEALDMLTAFFAKGVEA